MRTLSYCIKSRKETTQRSYQFNSGFWHFKLLHNCNLFILIFTSLSVLSESSEEVRHSRLSISAYFALCLQPPAKKVVSSFSLKLRPCWTFCMFGREQNQAGFTAWYQNSWLGVVLLILGGILVPFVTSQKKSNFQNWLLIIAFLKRKAKTVF